MNIPITVLRETWLKPHISDAQINFPDFNVFRADRIKRERGGCFLYIKEGITVTITKTYDDAICQAVFCLSPALNLMVFSVYKPCDASSTSFANMLDFISNCIAGSKDPYTFNILILGDLNFPEMWTM